MKVAIAQLNPVVGDVEGNFEKLENTVRKIAPGSADMIVFPELFLCGYPPRDLLTFPWFLDRLESISEKARSLSADRPDLGILVGTARRNSRRIGKGICNSAVLYDAGEAIFTQDKTLLPTYDVFDEQRYFDNATATDVFSYRGEKLGISICEDAWNDADFEKKLEYQTDPIERLAGMGATLMINISASPFHRRKEENLFERYAHLARKHSLPFLFTAQVGANDELIFDGRSMAMDMSGQLIEHLSAFEEEVRIIDMSSSGTTDRFPATPEMESIRQALVLGVRDYLGKSGFQSAVIGLSGGVDSSLTACIAVEAIGPDNVRGITMPSQYSSKGSVDDSLALAKNLGIRCDILPIEDIFNRYLTTLRESFTDTGHDATEENIQARIRGNLLMAYSNKFGSLVLNPGNKSELAVGYCTLYGDMTGGLGVISDLGKQTVYELARWYNREREIIPKVILTKAPSAELSTGQKDQDTLPPYDILDGILDLYLEQCKSPEEIVSAGFDADTVRWVLRAVDRSEYKRKQAAPGLRVTPNAFGSGRRMPIAAKWS